MTTATDPRLVAWLNAAWARQASVHRVEVEGASIAYRSWNLADTAKPGLVFVHGFRAHAHWWDHIAPHFTDAFRVIAVDLSGMGDSDTRPAYSRPQMGREVLAAAAHAGLGRSAIVAHSFGGATSLHACVTQRERVSRAIIVDAHLFRPETREGPPPAMPRRIYPTREAALARYRLTPPGLWPVPEILAYYGEHSIRPCDGGWTWKFDPDAPTSLHGEEFRDEMIGSMLPVDFIYAEHSEIVIDDEVDLVRRHLPNCGEPIMIPMSHHHIMIEQPMALVVALRGLLANPRQ